MGFWLDICFKSSEIALKLKNFETMSLKLKIFETTSFNAIV